MAPNDRISEADFESLPPALRRKFFSSYERLRLAQDGSCPIHLSNHERKLSKGHHLRLPQSPKHDRNKRLDRQSSFSTTTTTSSKSKLQRKRPQTASQAPKPFDQVDTTFYDSLPPTLRSKLFSREEQVLLASQRGSVIVDAADEVLHKRRQEIQLRRSKYQSSESLPIFRNVHYTEKGFIDDDISMDHPAFEGFRWLETPHEELDLRLDDYHTALTQATPEAAVPRRKPSFRRNLSLSTISFSRRNSTSDQNTLSATTRHSSISSSPIRPTSTLIDSRKHRSHASVSSIDPSAKYYRDPEARLKLRVYLASPQKFDEAIEFGFPSLEDRRQPQYVRPQTSPRITQDSARTFFSDDTPSLSEGDDDEREDLDNPDTPQDTEFRRFSKKSSERTGITRPRLRIEPYAHAPTNNREMTLHMTLTRPDLRSAEEMTPVRKINDLPSSKRPCPVMMYHTLFGTHYPKIHLLLRSCGGN